MTWSGQTDAGPRPVNEDGLALLPELGACFICDGMGGVPAGPLASETACRVMTMLLEQNRCLIAELNQSVTADPGSLVDMAAAMMETAGRQVHLAMRERALSGACTAALLILAGRFAIVAHVGDCRVYLVREGVANAITEDHVCMKPGEAGKPPQRMLTRVLGLQPHVQVETLLVELMPRDVLLACTDGISSCFSEAELADCCGKTPVDQAPLALTRAARSRGGRDNATVAAAAVHAVRMNVVDPASQIKTLKTIPLFAGLNYRQLAKVCEVSRVLQYPAGETIITEGQTDTDLYVLLKGEAWVIKLGVRLAELKTGSFFGEGNLLEPAERAADVIAHTDTVALVLRRSDLLALFASDASLGVHIAWSLAQVLNARLRKTSSELSFAKGGQMA
ncbi:MAG: cyclic nucleotide-binding domain-containing protein [Phycisphaeraceae bacterium]|nr:cyclic nucleotide-binding domain-containing protein [Phycisphaeraceae bacterium]